MLVHWDSCNYYQAPVPLSIFGSNSKFDENSECSGFEYTRPITTIFCTRHDSDTVVTCAKYRCDRIFYTIVFEFSSNFEFDRNMLSGTGARPVKTLMLSLCHSNKLVAQLPYGTNTIFLNAPFCNINVYIGAHFCNKLMHCGIFVSMHRGIF